MAIAISAGSEVPSAAQIIAMGCDFPQMAAYSAGRFLWATIENMARFYIENFGCRATQADGSAMERQFFEQGLHRAESAKDAEIVVVNTCTVTASADRDARAAIRRARRQNPEAQIVVTGCYAQRAPEEVAALPGVSKVIGNSHKQQLAQIVLSGFSREQDLRKTESPLNFLPLATLKRDGVSAFVSDIFAHTELLAAPVFEGVYERTRPNLKVQDGCGNRCSFCIIPSVRGNSRSLALAEVLREVHGLVDAGYREVVISGINLGRWGRDLANPLRFVDLIRAILKDTSLEKLRISSVEPMDWSDEVIALVAESPRIAKHAHVPMQSGSDVVLRRMHRKYRPWHYREKIERIRAAMPTAAIGADVMTGFPGETEAEFAETVRMIEELPFTYLHVFTYSARPGTPAADMPDQVAVRVARERTRVLRDLGAEKKRAFMRSFIGKTLQAITLNVSHDVGQDYTEALTDNFLQLHLRGRHASNLWVQAKIEGIHDERLLGRLTAEPVYSKLSADDSVRAKSIFRQEADRFTNVPQTS